MSDITQQITEPSEEVDTHSTWALVRLTAEQVGKNWEQIREALRKSFQDVEDLSEGQLAFALRALQVGRMQAWALILSTGESAELMGIMTTTASVDPILGKTSLFINSLHSLKYIPRKVWAEKFADLREFAIRRGYSEVMAFTNNKKLLLVVEALGGNTDTRLVRLEL